MFSMRHLHAASLLALPLLFACGSAAGNEHNPTALTDAGYAALGTSDWVGAGEQFERALALLEPGGAGFLRAALGEVEALVHMDPDLAEQRFLTLATSHPESVGPREFTTIGGLLAYEQQYTQAIAVVAAGLETRPGQARLTGVLDRIHEQLTSAQAAEDGGATEALDALSSMGYLGGKR